MNYAYKYVYCIYVYLKSFTAAQGNGQCNLHTKKDARSKRPHFIKRFCCYCFSLFNIVYFKTNTFIFIYQTKNEVTCIVYLYAYRFGSIVSRYF